MHKVICCLGTSPSRETYNSPLSRGLHNPLLAKAARSERDVRRGEAARRPRVCLAAPLPTRGPLAPVPRMAARSCSRDSDRYPRVQASGP